MISAILFGGILLAAGAAGAAEPCGNDVPCHVTNGEYRIELPTRSRARGALVFFHGYKSSAALTMRDDRPLIEVALAHGLAFVAADGRDGTWSVPGAPTHDRDEQVFVAAILDDLGKRFGFTSREIVLGGFSQGASMAWYTACLHGARVAGMVTFSGVFWNPPPKPEDCGRQIPPIVHFHGTADQTFPLAGRAIGTRFHQGDTFESTEIMRASAGCTLTREPLTLDRIACQTAPVCERGPITLCLHEGGHRTDPGQFDAGLTEIGFPR